jgi:L-galactonate 5-dehydrogenase
MSAKALITYEDQRFALEEVVLPTPGHEHVVVRTTYSGVSIGTEFAMIRDKLNRGAYPLCTGYQGVGVVEEVGRKVVGFVPGDKVYYRDNSPMKLTDGTDISMVYGTHCSHFIMDPLESHGFALLPEGVDDDVASMFVMPAVGLHGVNMSEPRLGDTVVVYGCGLIGLGVVNACSNRGCVVVAIDIDTDRLDVARKLGADHLINGATEDEIEALYAIAPDGADVVFECSGIPACVDSAFKLCRTYGKFIWQGHYGDAPLPYDFRQPHGRQVTTFYPCNDGLEPCRRAVLKNMARGVLPWHHTITHRASADEAPALYERINQGEQVIGAVIHWSD